MLAAVFYAVPELESADGEKETTRGAVRLWNIDTFEGGKGSRTAFLNRVSAEYEKAHKGTYVLVSSHTVEGATAAFEAGNYPDMLSFGIGFSAAGIAGAALESVAIKGAALQNKRFSGGELNGERIALPWCRGVYAIYSKENDFEQVTKETAVLSSGGKNLVRVAAATLPLFGELTVKDSAAAYVSFLSGKVKYLFGTQRDACRFHARGVNVYCKAIDGFSDLYQYVAVLTEDRERQAVCEGYIERLLGQQTQKKLTEIGMFSPYYDIYDAASPIEDELERAKVKKTIGVFTSDDGLRAANEAAERALKEGNAEVLKNFLKDV